MSDYQLLDSGDGRKLEKIGKYTIDRPSAQAFWQKIENDKFWEKADGIFYRKEENIWEYRSKIPERLVITHCGYNFLIKFTDFGHIGIFPEHEKSIEIIKKYSTAKNFKLLNMFAYTGAATIAGSKAGATVTHLDASQKINDWAKENIILNNLQTKSVRWITDDVIKFLKREVKRGNKYDGIILDPPTFGRGSKGEVFKIENDINLILELCKSILTENYKYLILSCHTPGFTPMVLKNLLLSHFRQPNNTFAEELYLKGKKLNLPSGSIVYIIR